MDIDAVIAEAQSAQPAAEASTEAPATSEIPQEPEVAEVKEDIGSKPDSELTPEQLAKRESNRRSHQASREARLKRENREMREALQRLSQQQPQQQPVNNNSGKPVKPNQSDYNDWEPYEAALDAYYEQIADWKLEQKLSERDRKSTEITQQARQQEYLNKGIETQAAKEAEFAKQVPDYMQTVFGEYADFMDADNLPLHVKQAIIEADNAAPALYALAKEGTLEDLADMSPYKVAAELAKAEMRGQQYLNRNKVTNAPAPTRSARGTGAYAKPMMDLPMEELLAKVSTRD